VRRISLVNASKFLPSLAREPFEECHSNEHFMLDSIFKPDNNDNDNDNDNKSV
jgi:hypothetical protein